MQNYTLGKTKNKDLFKVMDLNGDWTHYFHRPTRRYLRAVNYILNSGYAKGKGFEIWLRNATAEAANQKLKEAGERGDKVHNAIDYLFDNEGRIKRETPVWNNDLGEHKALSHDEWDCIVALQTFWEGHAPELIDHEYPVFNLKEGYAGTLDALIILTKRCENPKCDCAKVIGKVGLFDWKSSTGIRNSYGAQVAAYSNADNVQEHDYTAILRIGTNHKIGYEFEVYNKEKTTSHLREFMAAITISDADYKPFDERRDVRDIPDRVSLNLKKPKAVKKPKAKKTKHAKLKTVPQR